MTWWSEVLNRARVKLDREYDLALDKAVESLDKNLKDYYGVPRWSKTFKPMLKRHLKAFYDNNKGKF